MAGDPGFFDFIPPALDSSEDVGKECFALERLVELKWKLRELEAEEKRLRAQAVEEATHLLVNAGETKGTVFTSNSGSVIFKWVQNRKPKPEDHQDLYYHHEMMAKAREHWMLLHKETFTKLREEMDELIKKHEALEEQWNNLINQCEEYRYHKREYEEIERQMGGYTPQLQVTLAK